MSGDQTNLQALAEKLLAMDPYDDQFEDRAAYGEWVKAWAQIALKAEGPLPQGSAPEPVDPTAPFDPPTGEFRYPHILLNKTFRIPCGCRIEGHGTLRSPAIIDYCALHEKCADFIEDLIDADADAFVDVAPTPGDHSTVSVCLFCGCQSGCREDCFGPRLRELADQIRAEKESGK